MGNYYVVFALIKSLTRDWLLTIRSEDAFAIFGHSEGAMWPAERVLLAIIDTLPL
jgi:hypothetical protein